MKFSVLLPTRNRLEFLKYALASVMKQDYSNWEVIISDNFSDQDIGSYIQSLKDPRLRYFRTSQFLSVTDNWNQTIEKITGDYVIMLGDDDCLMAHYFSSMAVLIKEYSSPDIIYSGGFHYAYPGVLAGFPQGFLKESNQKFFQEKEAPFLVSKEKALALTLQSMSFHMVFEYNMQYVLMNVSFIKKLKEKGAFFQSCYPDYYAMNALMLNAEKILAYPKPMVIIGICPKSAGAYFLNRKEKQASLFLNNAEESSLVNSLEKIVLPGAEMRTCWLYSMEQLKENFKDLFPIQVDYQKYRKLQILETYKMWVKDENFDPSLPYKLLKQLDWKEKFLYAFPLHLLSLFLRICSKALGKNRVKQMVFFLQGKKKHEEQAKSFTTIEEAWNYLNSSR